MAVEAACPLNTRSPRASASGVSASGACRPGNERSGRERRAGGSRARGGSSGLGRLTAVLYPERSLGRPRVPCPRCGEALRRPREAVYNPRTMPVVRSAKAFIPTLKEAPADAQVASPQAARPRRLHPPARGRASTTTCRSPSARSPRSSDRPRGDGRHRRPGVLPAGAPPGRDLEGVGPLGGDGRQHVPAQGPQGRRLLPRHDARGDLHRHRPRRAALATGSCRRSGTRSRPSSATSRAPSPACCACASSR